MLDLETASDDELNSHLPRWDGVWSLQTRQLVRQLQATGVDLNDSWASTPQGWICPCCHRSKPELVRLTATGIMLCHLEWHHDHLRDRGKAILRARNPLTEGPDRVPLLRVIELCKGLFERFHEVLVCQDCNAAEGQAKLMLRGVVDRDFSFSPGEIAGFIKASPNAPHVVDAGVAEATWEKVRADFEDLVGFAGLMAERIAAGRHRKPGLPPHLSRGPTAEAILFQLAEGAGEWASPYRLVSTLSARSVRRQGAMSTGGKPRRAIAPTDAEFAEYDARQDATTQWRRAPKDWRCAACDRDRRQIMRRSNSGGWTGKLHGFEDYIPETNEVSRWRRGVGDITAVVFGGHAKVTICGDCRHIITDVKTREPHLTEASWSLAELRDLVAGAAPNTRHAVPLEDAIALARSNSEREEAATDYALHRAEARRARSYVEARQRRDHCTVDEALFTLTWDAGDSDEENAAYEERWRWLLDEARRLDP